MAGPPQAHPSGALASLNHDGPDAAPAAAMLDGMCC
jgi:hypothetical protein